MAYQPKNYKKFVATAATATLVATAIAPAALADQASTSAFTDVGDRYEEAVEYVVSNNISSGLTATKYGVNNSITRGDAAVMVAKAAGLMDEEAPNSGFSDVPARGAVAVNSLKAAGVINGISDTKFGFSDEISRGQAAYMLAQAFDLTGGDASDLDFTDVGENHRFAEEVAALVENNITSGVTPTSFGIDQDIKRGDFAIFLYRLSELVEPAPGTPEVASVSAINAKQIVVTFPSAVTAESLFANDEDGIFDANTVSVTSLDNSFAGTLSGELSEDGKSLTIETQFGLEGRYDVEVENVETITGEVIDDIFETIDVNDVAAPAIASTQTVSANQVRVSFTEPLQSLGTVSFKLSNGTVVGTTSTGVTNNFDPQTNNQVVTFTIGSDVNPDTNVIATFVGTQDYAGNLITPNPSTTTLYKGDVDGVEPVVTSVNPLNAREFEVNFSEELNGNPTVALVGDTGGTLTVTQDDTIPTKYLVETTTPIDGLQTVVVSAFSDLSGEAGDTFSRVVNFVEDTTDPVLQSTNVVTVNGVEFLQLNFNENVTKLTELDNLDVIGTKVVDFVTTPVTVTQNIPATELVALAGSNTSFRIALSDLLDGDDVEGAAYNLTVTGENSTSVDVGLVEDISGNASAASFNTSFTRIADGTPSSNTQATIDTTVDGNGVDVIDNNTLTVTFEQPVDGVTATNVANYRIDGAVVETAILNPVAVGGTQTVTLELAENSNLFTGARNVTISNVKARNGLAMDTFRTTESLNENVAPTFTNATLLTPTTVELTFSEAVTNATTATGDFELLIGGVEASTTVTTTQQLTADNTLLITFGTAVEADDLAKGLSITAVDSIDVMDAVQNEVSASSVVTVTQ